MDKKQENVENLLDNSTIPQRSFTEEDLLEIDSLRGYDSYEYETEEEYARGEGFWVDDDGNWIPIDKEDDDYLYDDDDDEDVLYFEDDDDIW